MLINTTISNENSVISKDKAEELTKVNIEKDSPIMPLPTYKIYEDISIRLKRIEFIKNSLTSLSEIFAIIRENGKENDYKDIEKQVFISLDGIGLEGSPDQISNQIDTYGKLIDIINTTTPNEIRIFLSKLNSSNRLSNLYLALDLSITKIIEWMDLNVISNKDTEKIFVAKIEEIIFAKHVLKHIIIEYDNLVADASSYFQIGKYNDSIK